nr:MAG: putative coat protein [Leviviridae sp.]
MLGNTITITLDGSGGTAKTLPLINQDGYSTEYFLDDTTVTYRAKVRHSRDKVKTGSQSVDRHTVSFERFLKPTDLVPLGSKSTVTFVIANDPNGVPSDIIDCSEAMSFYMVKAGGIAAKLLGWES